MLCTLLHLDGHIAAKFEILRQPHCREVAPAELLNNYISVQKNLAHVNRVVPSDLVVGHALVLTRVVVLEERVVKLLFQWSEVSLVVVSVELAHGRTRSWRKLTVNNGT